MFGITYIGKLRSTVLIDSRGKIAQIGSKAKPGGHTGYVPKASKTLGKAS